MDNDISREILSLVTIYSKYAKYIPELKRRETWPEIVLRVVGMHCKRYPKLEADINSAFSYVLDKKVLPSMRSLQFGGRPIELSEVRGYNCSLVFIDDILAFNETMFLLLMGCGVGYSVQEHHVSKLPPLLGCSLRKGRRKRFLIEDSIQGWAETIRVLISSYFNGTQDLDFDYRDIRPKGARLVTSGGKAPGPQPLKDCVHNIRKVLDNALTERGKGTQLTTLEAHDIMCYIADAVLSGGIRRAACIAFFSFDDAAMLGCKTGRWYETHPQRGRANNSVVLLRHKLKQDDFNYIWDAIKDSRCGEPGFYLSNDKDMLSNPCGEASLKPNEFCNLTTINGANIVDQADFEARCKAAAFIGTLQAAYTGFHYLREEWIENTERDALLGISITGLANTKLLDNIDFEAGAKVCKEENLRVSKLLGIKKAARLTNIKPEGTTSCVLGCSSGIHDWHAPYYIRRVRVGKREPLYLYLKKHCPGILEDDFYKPDTDAVIQFPMKAPEGAITRNSSTAIDLLNRIKKMYKEWIVPGHRKGSNTHSVSATVTIKDNEWDEARDWMWRNKDTYAGLTVLPYDLGSHRQAPFEECTKAEYEALLAKIKAVDLSKIVEEEDNVAHAQETACAGGACQIVKVG